MAPVNCDAMEASALWSSCQRHAHDSRSTIRNRKKAQKRKEKTKEIIRDEQGPRPAPLPTGAGNLQRPNVTRRPRYKVPTVWLYFDLERVQKKKYVGAAFLRYNPKDTASCSAGTSSKSPYRILIAAGFFRVIH